MTLDTNSNVYAWYFEDTKELVASEISEATSQDATMHESKKNYLKEKLGGVINCYLTQRRNTRWQKRNYNQHLQNLYHEAYK